MPKNICGKCHHIYDSPLAGKCPNCNSPTGQTFDFQNDDTFLNESIPKILEERKEFGLEGLVKGLNCIIINTEPEKHRAAVEELLKYTGFQFKYTYEWNQVLTSVLSCKNSPDLLIQSRKLETNPFRIYNNGKKIHNLPNTRLETFVFATDHLDNYVKKQKARGISFLTDEILNTSNYSFIQSKPTPYMGISYGFIEWKDPTHDYYSDEASELNWNLEKPSQNYLKNIGRLDHTATRVRAKDRDAAIIEFMKYTNYNFDFAVYVKHLNSITSVARLSATDFAMVFTSGITAFENITKSGPTEGFIYNYGTRTHHMAFDTTNIEDTFSELQNNKMDFLIDLVGSREEGLKQTFSAQSPNTMLVNEYIHRYDDFDGFFTKSNVTDLTKSTEKQ
ncbi:hypothetical protein NEF87_000324 [Candidatus Lokiarchaeum ossiferum]|uniref:VOC domain-containing protein n=1 Tax=Candidatus Lokiarchaeum ossiferum TaxID=2951803 RepID=A0ABY6HNG9_9ARCH|nr:hypothetical protein NEF87_000324 [Candidatus Lokiarchaeum sp. B-35]